MVHGFKPLASVSHVFNKGLPQVLLNHTLVEEQVLDQVMCNWSWITPDKRLKRENFASVPIKPNTNGPEKGKLTDRQTGT